MSNHLDNPIGAKLEFSHKPRIWRMQSIDGVDPSVAQLSWSFEMSDSSALELLRWENKFIIKDENKKKKISADPDDRHGRGVWITDWSCSRSLILAECLVKLESLFDCAWKWVELVDEAAIAGSVKYARCSTHKNHCQYEVHLSWKSASKLQIFALLSITKQYLFLFI